MDLTAKCMDLELRLQKLTAAFEQLNAEVEQLKAPKIPGGLGEPGIRDPENECEEFDPGQPPARGGGCRGDGHYLCKECVHYEGFDRIAGQHEKARRDHPEVADFHFMEMGWDCPTSPTQGCVYDVENDPSWDFCLYCGDPYERK
jgi:hypothetical protein